MVKAVKITQHDFDVGSSIDVRKTKDDDQELGETIEKPELPGLQDEKWWHITIQVSIPFFIAGIGTIGAGIILGHVEVSCAIKYQQKSTTKFH